MRLSKLPAAFGLVLLLSTALSPAVGRAGASTISPVAGVRIEIFSFPSDPPGVIREAPGGGRVLTPSMLYMPARGENMHGPAIIMIDQGPGSHPARADQPTRWAAERLAQKGYTVLSLQTHLDRGYPLFAFEETAIEINAALTNLEARGYEEFAIIGNSYGAIAAANYLATNPDTSLDIAGARRIKAVVLIDPLTELRKYPGADLENPHTDALMQAAAMSTVNGTGKFPANNTLEVGGGPGEGRDDWVAVGKFVSSPEGILNYFGPPAERRNALALRKLPVPSLMIVGGRDPVVSMDKLEALKAAAPASAPIEIAAHPQADGAFVGERPQVVSQITDFLAMHGLAPRAYVTSRIVDAVTKDGTTLPGILYTPDKIDPKKPAIIMVHGRAGDIVQSSTHWMAWRLAQRGYVVLAPSMRISGAAGLNVSSLGESAEDIGAWMNAYAALGYKRVIATGHSNGGIWISNYKALSQDPRIVGMVYYAPTAFGTVADTPERRAQQAEVKAAVDSGQEYTKIFGLVTAHLLWDEIKPGTRMNHPNRVAEFNVPALSIIGSTDNLFKGGVFMAEFRSQYKGPLTELTYEGGTHGLRENKDRVAADTDAWIKKTFK